VSIFDHFPSTCLVVLSSPSELHPAQRTSVSKAFISWTASVLRLYEFCAAIPFLDSSSISQFSAEAPAQTKKP